MVPTLHSVVLKIEEEALTIIIDNMIARVPPKLSWRQARLVRRFAALEAEEADKLVGEVEHGAGHRLGVNVVTADRVANTVVPEEKVRRSAQVRSHLKQITYFPWPG